PCAFIGSTSTDLPEYREAARRACEELHLGVVDMRSFEAADLDTVRASLAQLEKATVYVGIFAYRYGFVVPGDDRSVTEREFDRAGELGIERLCFLVDPAHPWPEERKERGALGRVEALHRKVMASGLVAAFFTTADDLKHKAYRALDSWMKRRGALGPRQVPAPVADFVGRAEQLGALLDHFDRGATICGVRGQGGVGKT